MKTAFLILVATAAFSTWMVEDAFKYQYSKGSNTAQIVQAAEVEQKEASNLPAEVIIAPPTVIIRPR